MALAHRRTSARAGRSTRLSTLLFLAIAVAVATLAAARPLHPHHRTHAATTIVKRDAVPTHTQSRRTNLFAILKDKYLMKVYKNYYCTAGNRVIPVDRNTGHALTGDLRKRDWDSFLNMHQKEHGACKNPTWIKLLGWSDPIPMAQAMAQYPEVFGLPRINTVNQQPVVITNPATGALGSGPTANVNLGLGGGLGGGIGASFGGGAGMGGGLGAGIGGGAGMGGGLGAGIGGGAGMGGGLGAGIGGGAGMGGGLGAGIGGGAGMGGGLGAGIGGGAGMGGGLGAGIGGGAGMGGGLGAGIGGGGVEAGTALA
ncbi:hypothetical protein ACQY0O_000581 [Thecaphora frezii]